jgi:hypothetical protein
MNVRSTMRATRGFIAAVVGLAALLSACTGSGSETLNPTSTAAPSTPTPTQAQPLTCPQHWDFSPVEGSDQILVPGNPTAAVGCIGHHQRFVHTGSQLTQLVDLLNSRRHIDPNDCIHNLGGMVLDMTQMYFNYPNGEIQVLNLDPNCQTVSNGELTARIGQATT